MGGAINAVAHSFFKIGDRVVHPQHGVGQVVQLEEREFERGVMRNYYEVHIPDSGTVWVPVDLSNSGLRRLAHKPEHVAHTERGEKAPENPLHRVSCLRV